jgi:GT2 family glycosyltransferase/glycosyltransferase involved in cell wall biosynthesis
VVVHGFPPAALGGTEVYAEAHARALHTLGDTVCVLTREADPGRPEYDVRIEDRGGLHVAFVNNTFRATRSFEETYRNDHIGRIAGRLIDDFRPEIAHIHHLTCLSTSIVGLLAQRRIPSFLTLHDYWLICHRGQLLDVDCQPCEGPEPDGCRRCLGEISGAPPLGMAAAPAVRAVVRRLPAEPARRLRQAAHAVAALAFDAAEGERQARRRFDTMRQVCADVTRFIAPSRAVRDRFVRFGVAPDRITVSPHGIDTRLLERAGRTPAPHVRLGFLGSLMVSKGPHVLLEAAVRLPRGRVTVDLFGGHAAYHGDEAYRRRIEPLLAQEGVRAHGSIGREQLAAALASIDLLVVPSVWPETSSLAILEAFAAGVPVVASRIGALPELVADGRNGLLFQPGDPDDLAKTLERVLREPELLEKLRAGIPALRTIEADARAARELYAAQLGRTAAARNGEGGRIAAVVLNYRTPDETRLAVGSLLASTIRLDQVIVVDNDEGETAREALRGLGPDVTYLHTGRNLGFSGGMNAGIREAQARGADAVLLTNSDVIVPPDCLARLMQALHDRPGAGIVGPMVLVRSDPGRVASLGMSYAPASGRMRHEGFGRAVGLVEAAGDQNVDGVSGCLMLVRRAVFDAIGLLDDDYFFGFEDLDFCLRARRAGFATVLARSAAAYHEGGRSMGSDAPRRLFFAARNHLMLARRADPDAGAFASFARSSSIVMLNVAHAVRARGASLPARLSAVARGVRDYARGRVGADGS